MRRKKHRASLKAQRLLKAFEDAAVNQSWSGKEDSDTRHEIEAEYAATRLELLLFIGELEHAAEHEAK